MIYFDVLNEVGLNVVNELFAGESVGNFFAHLGVGYQDW